MPVINTAKIINIALPMYLFLLFRTIIYLFKNKSLLQKVIEQNPYQYADQQF